MDYVYRLLGIRTKYEEDAITSVPNFIYARYSLRKATLDGVSTMFLY